VSGKGRAVKMQASTIARVLILLTGLTSLVGSRGASAQAPAGPTGAPPGGNAPAETAAPATAATKTALLTGSKEDVNGKFNVSFSMPGPKGPGNKAEIVFTLAVSGNALTGQMTDPDDPAQVRKIENGKVDGNQFSFQAKSGTKTYAFTGTASKEKLLKTERTTELFVLDPGSKVKTAKTAGVVDGAYLVAVHSPGGAMDNIMFLKTNGTALEGKMVMISSPTKDWSDFSDGTVDGNKVSFYTKTPQSTFHFSGQISGEVIQLNLEVTDEHVNVEGRRIAASAGK